MKKILFFISLSISICVFFACSDNRSQDEKKTSSLPKAQGIAGRILIVSDSVFWNESISGQTMDSLLSINQKGLINPESVFDYYNVPMSKWTHLLQKRHCIVFPLILNEENHTNKKVKRMFSKEFLQKVETDTNFFYYQKDIVCRNQTFMFLIAPNRQVFYERLMKKKKKIQEKLYQLSIRHKQNVLSHNYDLEKKVFKKHKISMDIPKRYSIVKEETDFLWLRKNAYNKSGYDINIFIKSDDYISQDQFSDDYVWAWREQIGASHFVDPEDSTEYMITESYVPPHFQVKYLNKRYSKNMRGLWRLKEGVTGGSFVSYVFYHSKKDKLYYIEGFINCPGKKKTKYIYEVEALLHSIKIY